MEERVWDLAVRVSHWVLAGAVLTSWWTGEQGMMDIHLISGYVVLATVLFRIAWGFVGSDTARFLRFPVGPRRVLAYFAGFFKRDGEHRWLGHNPGGALMVLFMLAYFGFQAALGMMTSDDILVEGPLVAVASSELVERAGDLHHELGEWVPWIAGLHVLTVLFYLVWKRQPLIQAMVTGRRVVDPGTTGSDAGQDLRPAGAEALGAAPRFASSSRALVLAAISSAIVYGVVSWGRAQGF